MRLIGLGVALGLCGGLVAACGSDPQAVAPDAAVSTDLQAPDGGLELPGVLLDGAGPDGAGLDGPAGDTLATADPGPLPEDTCVSECQESPTEDGVGGAETADGPDAPGAADATDVTDATDAGDADGPTPDVSEPEACPAPPPGLPDVTPQGAGRWWLLGPVGSDGASPLLPRLIRVYLPAAYEAQPDARFPVLYMHDGQNLFEDADAAFGVEWRVDETLDALTAAGEVEPHIVVGVDNTAERMDDYTPSFDATVGAGGKGDAYADFLADVVKPLVDLHFRTRCGRANTAVAGSSLGGLISLHMAMRRPETFGVVGCVSPSLWWGGGLETDAWAAYQGPLPERIWFDAGSAEGGEEVAGGGDMVAGIRAAREAALGHGLVFGDSLGYLEDPGALHNEAAWAARLDSILRFLLAPARPVDSPITAAGLTVYGPYLVADGDPAQTSVAVEVTRAGVRETLAPQQAALSSLDPAVATVSSDGVVTAVSGGVTRLEADLGAFHPSAPVVVADASHAAVTFFVTAPPGTDAVAVVGGPAPLGAWDGVGLPMTWLREDTYRAAVLLSPGEPFEYKYTRGSWETVEKGAGGAELANRAALAEQGVKLEDSVATWADWP